MPKLFPQVLLGQKAPALAVTFLTVLIVLPNSYIVAQRNTLNSYPIRSISSSATEVSFHMPHGTLRIEPCRNDIVRVTYAPQAAFGHLANPFLFKNGCGAVPFTIERGTKDVSVITADLVVDVSRTSGAVSFEDHNGTSLLRESDWPFPRKLEPTVTDGVRTLQASVWFALTPEERLYGLGQHQDALLNQRNLEFELTQDNTNISIPVFLSSKGYGVFWNNASATHWNNRFQPVVAIRSSMSSAVDYFFLYGPDFDKIIGGYRQLTGTAPLFPRWAYGFWQSKLAYNSQAEITDVADKYRNLKIPIDAIVLDAGWETSLGSRVFNNNFPNRFELVQQLHSKHVHLMVSIWPLFQPGSATFHELLAKGLFVTPAKDSLPPYYVGTRLYDAFSPEARRVYWRQVRDSLYDAGVDAYWMDSDEPSDFYGEEHRSMLAGAATAIGNGSRYLNLYPFMTTKAIYDGQREQTSRKRVFILSRSAFAGTQRNAAAVWSGDIATNFQTLRREIPAGLNFSMTGLPYWTTDIGGFLGGDTDDPAYREVFVRWFQYGAFCPVFRVHGTRSNHENELWSYGEQAQSILTLYDRLRYRLLPYIYSLAARTTLDGYTPMRALAFDFRSDPKALDINDEFMFGPSILVAPVTRAGAASREVYLPGHEDWYDFWTGERLSGGQEVNRQTPLQTMPLYVRSGTILPLGPESEYSDEFPGGPITLRIYTGADARYVLYNDDGSSYDYEKGAYSKIAMHWNDSARTLAIDARQGQFHGMPSRRNFNIILVSQGNGVGEAVNASDRTISYDGSAETIQF
ncbi:TIM-barrel domain-containing protein [Alloacidobacterium sp.]|uniref:glycoside hydrolase family 31 protein n=1 Tax=Alloacidobacterium sp. TaxID=2951999 RepID=UPI002D238B86|nr:TIM-barrel domain-containing protein [Alloacidobacterium sp.]HYK37295.1 TIM-barrel domain-containing protein [Alloacidobacterium sp.]